MRSARLHACLESTVLGTLNSADPRNTSYSRKQAVQRWPASLVASMDSRPRPVLCRARPVCLLFVCVCPWVSGTWTPPALRGRPSELCSRQGDRAGARPVSRGVCTCPQLGLFSGLLRLSREGFSGLLTWGSVPAHHCCAPRGQRTQASCSAPRRGFPGRASLQPGAGVLTARRGSGAQRGLRRTRRPQFLYLHRVLGAERPLPQPLPPASPPFLPRSLTTGPSASRPVKRCGHVFAAVSATSPLSTCVHTTCIPSGGWEGAEGGLRVCRPASQVQEGASCAD